MKKILILSMFVMLSTTGCFVKKDKPVEPKPDEPKKELSLMEWFEQGKGVECVIQAEEGEVVVYSQGDKVRMEGASLGNEGADGSMISDGEWTYMWSGDVGTKMNIKEMEVMAGDEQAPEEAPEDWQDNIETWEEMNVEYDCDLKSLDDDLFIPPSNVEFQDLTVMMEGVMQMGEELETKFEAGQIPSEIDMEEMREMMEEFGN